MYFVIQVISGKESSIVNILNRKISKDIILECFVPIRERLKKYNGKWQKVQERYFPGYIFIDTNNPKLLFNELKKIGEFTKILGRQVDNNFLSLSKDESDLIDSLMGKENNRITDISLIDIKEGNKIEVVEGPLVGFEGRILKVNLHKRTVSVLLDMCGREIEVLLGIDFIKKNELA